MRFEIPQIGTELVQIREILPIFGLDEALKPFRNTQATFPVDSLDDFRAYPEEKGAGIIRKPNKVPTGRNMTVKHPDGSVIKYVGHTKVPESQT
ncbi:VOC family protein [Methanosarcina sp. T3]|uniref:VOC family protein n=1 Tax=Methanosarcina sp. T3 TaxID=3439062 RepID=UPI003F86F5F8